LIDKGVGHGGVLAVLTCSRSSFDGVTLQR
jgi:hypothetical protein